MPRTRHLLLDVQCLVEINDDARIVIDKTNLRFLKTKVVVAVSLKQVQLRTVTPFDPHTLLSRTYLFGLPSISPSFGPF
jgi:hypothetical protein